MHNPSRRFSAVLPALLLLVFSSTGKLSASSLVPSVDRTIGSGTHSILLAIDFNDGQAKDFVTWSYSFDSAPGNGFLHDLLIDLATRDSAFTYAFTDWGWGITVDRLAVNDPPLTHDRDSTTAEYPRDWWSLWTAEPPDSAWTASGTGASSLSVVSGNLYGFNFEPDWNNPGTAPNAIPEPGLLGLILLGIGGLTWLRRRAS